ncbi:MAG: S23 ribosomal protein [Candidatus Gallionella acididurans]|uniref:S23 ribosomal protein n=1 Tax=Candidatus Gallionella acididurans TaxID=1796491 RepID=A0A139BSV9_9PROT|nr:MAG: S23 ribosomal protein [Candidatus Gallionella acididurans]
MGQKVDRFEDLIAWQKARQLAAEIYQISAQGDFSRDFGLRDQIRRAAVSTMSNIAEGFDRGSRSEFHQFLVIAKASCAEVRPQLYVAQDVGYIDQKIFDTVSSSASELSRIIGGLRAAVQKQRDEK